jgi:hypothetical protein
MASGSSSLNMQDRTVVVVCACAEPVMLFFYLIVTPLLLISLGLLDVTSTFSDSDFFVATPTMSTTVSDFDADAPNPVSGFDVMR